MNLRSVLAPLMAFGLFAAAGRVAAQSADSTVRADTVLAAPVRSIPEIGANRSGLSAVGQDTVRRPRAIEYSDAYNVRLTIHRYASYAELPLFVAEYFVGNKVLKDERASNSRSSLKGLHSTLAGGLEALFAINTVTGLWNLYESRHDPAGRTRRIIHSLAMLAADAGFLYTASIAEDARRTDAGANKHRNVAVASMSVATASTLMMWLWKD